MNLSRLAWLACLLAFSARPASAEDRQFYSKYWQKTAGYYFRHYYFKPEAPTTGYRHHLVIYYPNRPGHYFYYSPYTGKYWGRWDCSAHGFSRLEPNEQREKIADCREGAFPKPGPMPSIPESTDGVAMLPPQEKLPPVEGQVLFPPDELKELTRESARRTTGLTEKQLPRQFFSDWCLEGTYFFRCCYYQPVADGPYQSQRLVYYPTRPRHISYYNPYESHYWGRYDLEARGFSLLRADVRKAKLADIPETAYPMPLEMPTLPGSMDSIKLVVPPRDLPE